jgi:AcrR family transcriptional regulator
MSDERRPYRKQRRAELEAQTRLRIVEGLVELHGSVGPARTSVSAVAERAGVRRSTVYRHFPDEAAMFAACSAHWAAANPFPDLDAWSAVADPQDRTRRALAELYGVYDRGEQMLANLLRDEDHVPVLGQLLGGYRGYLTSATERLIDGRRPRGPARRRCAAAVGHAVSFSTWRSLVREQKLSQQEAVKLMVALVAAAS